MGRLLLEVPEEDVAGPANCRTTTAVIANAAAPVPQVTRPEVWIGEGLTWTEVAGVKKRRAAER